MQRPKRKRLFPVVLARAGLNANGLYMAPDVIRESVPHFEFCLVGVYPGWKHEKPCPRAAVGCILKPRYEPATTDVRANLEFFCEGWQKLAEEWVKDGRTEFALSPYFVGTSKLELPGAERDYYGVSPYSPGPQRQARLATVSRILEVTLVKGPATPGGAGFLEAPCPEMRRFNEARAVRALERKWTATGQNPNGPLGELREALKQMDYEEEVRAAAARVQGLRWLASEALWKEDPHLPRAIVEAERQAARVQCAARIVNGGPQWFLV